MREPVAPKFSTRRTPRLREIAFGALVDQIALDTGDAHETARQLNALFASGGVRFANPSPASLLALLEAHP